MKRRQTVVVEQKHAQAIGPRVTGAILVSLHDVRHVGNGYSTESAHRGDKRALQGIFEADEVIDLVALEIAKIETLVGLRRRGHRLVVSREDDLRHLPGLRSAL